MSRTFVGPVLALMLLPLSGCGEDPSQTLPAAPPVTVTAPAPVVTVTEEPAAAVPPPTSTQDPEPPPSGASEIAQSDAATQRRQVEEGVIPDVVGMDHQLAQDTMQAAGYYHLAEEDATGEGRMLLVDRNWVVVEQEPSAGTAAAEDATIIIRSKKSTD